MEQETQAPSEPKDGIFIITYNFDLDLIERIVESLISNSHDLCDSSFG